MLANIPNVSRGVILNLHKNGRRFCEIFTFVRGVDSMRIVSARPRPHPSRSRLSARKSWPSSARGVQLGRRVRRRTARGEDLTEAADARPARNRKAACGACEGSCSRLLRASARSGGAAAGAKSHWGPARPLVGEAERPREAAHLVHGVQVRDGGLGLLSVGGAVMSRSTGRLGASLPWTPRSSRSVS